MVKKKVWIISKNYSFLDVNYFVAKKKRAKYRYIKIKMGEFHSKQLQTLIFLILHIKANFHQWGAG